MGSLSLLILIFEKEEGNNHYELFCTLDRFDDLIADDDLPNKYELWCCILVIHEIVEFYKFHHLQ